MLTRRLALLGGILAGTLVTWAVQHTFRFSMTRRALFPWGAAGGASAVLLLVAQANRLGEHRAFLVTTIADAVLLCLIIRWTIDLGFGPIDEPSEWEATTDEVPLAAESGMVDLSVVQAESPRPSLLQANLPEAGRVQAELKLVSPDLDRKRVSGPHSRHVRNSG